MNSEKLDIDFSTVSEFECLRFSKKVDFGKIKGNILKNTIIENIKSKSYYSEEEAIITIKNILLALFNISFERTDFRTYCGEALLYLANFIKVEGSINYKILYAEYMSQVEKDEKSLKKSANELILDDMLFRIKSFTSIDKEKSLEIKEKITNLKNNSRFRFT